MIEAAQRAPKSEVEGGALEDGAEGHLRAGGREEREGARSRPLLVRLGPREWEAEVH